LPLAMPVPLQARHGETARVSARLCATVASSA
jgi:hypothetical protein